MEKQILSRLGDGSHGGGLPGMGGVAVDCGGYREATIYTKEECKTCWARYLCSGACAHTSAVHGGDVFHAPTCYCDIYKGLDELALYAYWKLKEWDEYILRNRLEKADKQVNTL